MGKGREKKLEQILLNTWSVHEAYRRLGIPAEDIFVCPKSGPERDRVFMRAVHGERTFDFDVGPRPIPANAFVRAWQEFVALIQGPNPPIDYLANAYNDWASRNGSVEFVMLVKVKLGLTPRRCQ
jgi:hypothetical protein